MQDDGRLCDAAGAADAVIDTLRHLLNVLGALLASPAGQRAAQDVTELRSLPALAKILRRLWFDTELGPRWDSKEQAVWLCRVLAVNEGSRAGLLSFYGAGLLVVDAVAAFAEVALAESSVPLPLDEAWIASAVAVQDVLRGRHWEQLQQWPADRRCGGGSEPMLSTSRLPKALCRVLDLEGVRLTKVQAAGLGMAMMMPGSMTLALGGVGCALLVKKAREQSSSGSQEVSKWQTVQSGCLHHAHELLRRKARPIEIRYCPSDRSCPKQIKVSLYSTSDPLCALPVGIIGAISGSGTGGESVGRLGPGEVCSLRPPGSFDSFRLRVYEPARLLDVTLHDGIEVRRGDKLVIVLSDGRVRFFPEGKRASGSSSAPPLCEDNSLGQV